MSELDQAAWNAALGYETHGNDIVNAAYNVIVEHKRHISVSAVTAGISVYLQHEPQNIGEFLVHFPDAVGKTTSKSKMLNDLFDHFESVLK